MSLFSFSHYSFFLFELVFFHFPFFMIFFPSFPIPNEFHHEDKKSTHFLSFSNLEKIHIIKCVRNVFSLRES